jgi:hypothetical protein
MLMAKSEQVLRHDTSLLDDGVDMPKNNFSQRLTN